MASGPPRELAHLLEAPDAGARDEAWAAFLETQGELLLDVARSFGGPYDAAMDRYEYVLEGLRRDDFKRLRAYSVRPRSRFESWLVVVARRLCYDFTRGRYGRSRSGEGDDTREERAVRRRLADLTGLELEADILPDPAGVNPERNLRESELSAALADALDQLPARDRLLLTLRYEDDLPARKVAEVLDYPSAFHVYRRERTVLKELRAALRDRGIDGSTP